jgi:hypothetical protein
MAKKRQNFSAFMTLFVFSGNPVTIDRIYEENVNKNMKTFGRGKNV